MILILITAFISLVSLIILHELGHFLFAKKLGVKVEEFGLGYPPRIWGKKIGETLYSLNLLPLGGFVRIYGQEAPIKGDHQSFSEKPFWQKSLIILGGVFSFWVISAIILSIVMFIGAPTMVEDFESAGLINPKVQIIGIEKGSPAEKAGLKLGDVILKVSNSGLEPLAVNNVKEIQDFSHQNLGKEVFLTIQRGTGYLNIPLTLREEGAPMGVEIVRTALKKYPWYEAPVKGIQATGTLTVAVVQSWVMVLANLFKGQWLPAGVQVTGIVGIFQLFTEIGGLGVSYFLQFIAVIAVHLALINSLPLPALDGGWFLFLVIEKIKGSPLNQKLVQRTSVVFFFFLVILMIWITIKDIIRIF